MRLLRSFSSSLRCALVFAALVAPGCSPSSDSGGAVIVSEPGPTVGTEPREQIELPRDTEPDAGPSRVVPGALLVEGPVEIGGVTDDGYVGYFHNPLDANGGRTRWSAQVLDTRTRTSQSLGARSSVRDVILTRGKAVALWTSSRAPYGHADLTVWTKATGAARAPSPARSLPYLFAVNDDATRIAFSYGETTLPAVTNLAIGTPSFDVPPRLLGRGLRAGCPVEATFVGPSLFATWCDATASEPTLHALGGANELVTLTPGVQSFSVDAEGTRVLAITSNGDATVHHLPGGAVTSVATDVRSGLVTRDGSAVVYTTRGGALERAALSTPIAKETLVPEGVRDVLLASPDRAHAVVAAGPTYRHATYGRLQDLQLVSLTAPGPKTPLVATPTSAVLRFTRSGSHVLYVKDVPEGTDVQDAKLCAASVSGGEEIVLGPPPALVMQPEGSTKIVWLERRPGLRYDVHAVDLEGGGAPQRVIADVTSATAYGNMLYVSIAGQGLYAIPLP